MVAKISYGNNSYGALSYNFEKVEDNVAKVLETNRLRYNTDGTVNLSSVMYDFDLFLQDRIRTEKPIIHISLNSHPDDKLDDEQLAEIGKEYIEKLGFGNQPYIIYKHEDISRQHLHIVSLRVDENGKKLNDKFEKMRSVKILEDLEKKYGVTFIDHNNSCVFNGSRLGKSFSANAFEEMFSNPYLSPARDVNELDNSTQNAVQSNEHTYQDDKNLGGILGVLSLNN